MTPSDAMHLDELELRNFRRFKELTLSLHPNLTVIVAENGGGKTAVLDGIAVALRYFVDELRSVSSSGFAKGDVRLAQTASGSMVPTPPTSLMASATIAGQSTSWQRTLASLEGRTTHADASQLRSRARELLQKLIAHADGLESEPPSLPLIAYYGTGRLWSEHKLTEPKVKTAKDLSLQVNAYLDCLSPSSSYNHFVAWFEKVVREAQNEAQTKVPSPHRPQQLLAAVRQAVDTVLSPSGWSTLDWDFLTSEVVAVHLEQGRLAVSLLSDGIRNLIALVADLAHRAVRLNPHLGERACAACPGIVLIDEVDMHLHPSWQQSVVVLLQQAFPEVQFVVTTHSPLVISTVPGASVRIVMSDGTVTQPDEQTEGYDSTFALGTVFGVDSSPPVATAQALSEYRRLIEQGQSESERALKLCGDLTEHFGETHPAIIATKGLKQLQDLKARMATQGKPA
jgi:predicted ATP-binding protein involved in virulence